MVGDAADFGEGLDPQPIHAFAVNVRKHPSRYRTDDFMELVDVQYSKQPLQSGLVL